MNSLLSSLLSLVLLSLGMATTHAGDNDWPRTLPLEEGMMTIYSPQVDKLNDDTLHFRAALAYRETADSEPVFGAGWFEAPVLIDKTSRIVHPGALKVSQTRFPAGTRDLQSDLTSALAQQSPSWNLDFSLGELEKALKLSEAESAAAQKLNTAPPQIIYRDHPALLITMDGDPVLREIEDSPYQAVINTPYPLIFNGKNYYLNAAKDVWYRSRRSTGPYEFDASPPADIAAMVNPDGPDVETEESYEKITAANAPEIIVSTRPAELIVTEGPAAFVPLVDDLLVLQNSDDDVFMHVSAQEYYIVLAGRWYRSGSLNGPWSYQAADSLPRAFANIPEESDQADSRVYVAGTPEAEEAVLDAQVPQTAAVERGEVDIEVEYDGQPVYKAVDGTDLVYIENTGSTVLVADGLYYLVENGVWYVSASPNGPWQVSDHRPETVSSILPTSPVHNVKYVHVYDSTPQVVYVGYTPGYVGSYVYHNTIFYGSGWHYRPWVSPYYYYPRHSTWGFHVGYNSWNGWSFGLSWGWGPFSISYYSGGYWHRHHHWHHRHYGHWGPRGYRHRPRHHGYRGDRYAHHGGGRGGSGRDGHRNPGNGPMDPGRGGRGGHNGGGGRVDPMERNDNLYRDNSQRAKIADTRDNQPRPPSRMDHNVGKASFAGTSGKRQKSLSGLKKGERNQIAPVKSSDLRMKADIRDVNAKASRGMLLADNSGKVYRPTDNATGRSKKGSRQTIQPVNRNTSGQPVARGSNGQARKRSTSTTNAPVRQTQPVKSGRSAKQRTQPVTSMPTRQTQPTKTSRSEKQRTKPVSRTPVQQTQPARTGKSVSQRSKSVAKAPAQRTQPVNTGRSTRQQAPARVTAPPPRQSNSRVSTPPQKTTKTARNKNQPVRSAPKSTAKRSDSARGASTRNTEKRSKANQSRN